MSASHPSFFEPLPASAIDPLDAGVLRGLLGQARLECALEVVQQIDSTNSELLRRARNQRLEADRFLLAAEFQVESAHALAQCGLLRQNVLRSGFKIALQVRQAH